MAEEKLGSLADQRAVLARDALQATYTCPGCVRRTMTFRRKKGDELIFSCMTTDATCVASIRIPCHQCVTRSVVQGLINHYYCAETDKGRV